MRMDPAQSLTAADVVNTYGGDALAAMFRESGREPGSPGGSPGHRRRTDRSRTRWRWRRDRARRHPGSRPPPRRSSGQAGVPGRAHRGQRRTRCAPGALRTASSASSRRGVGSRCWRTTPVRTGWSRASSPRPRPAGARARPGCRACAAPVATHRLVFRGSRKPSVPPRSADQPAGRECPAARHRAPARGRGVSSTTTTLRMRARRGDPSPDAQRRRAAHPAAGGGVGRRPGSAHPAGRRGGAASAPTTRRHAPPAITAAPAAPDQRRRPHQRRPSCSAWSSCTSS